MWVVFACHLRRWPLTTSAPWTVALKTEGIWLHLLPWIARKANLSSQSCHLATIWTSRSWTPIWWSHHWWAANVILFSSQRLTRKHYLRRSLERIVSTNYKWLNQSPRSKQTFSCLKPILSLSHLWLKRTSVSWSLSAWPKELQRLSKIHQNTKSHLVQECNRGKIWTLYSCLTATWSLMIRSRKKPDASRKYLGGWIEEFLNET